MPLGDSVTEGIIDSAGEPSYRKYLWDQVTGAGTPIDLVGSRHGVRGTSTDSMADPDPGGVWDKDHDGHWGWRVDQILNGNGANGLLHHGVLADWLAAHTPDVLLVHLGTNDVFQGQSTGSTIAELTTVVATARDQNPNVTIYLSTLIPSTRSGGAFQPGLDALNAALPGFVAAQNTAQSPVKLVNSAAGYNPSWNYDAVHPDVNGQQHLASRFAAAFLADFPPSPPTTTQPPPPPSTTTTTTTPVGGGGDPDPSDCGSGYFLGERDGDVWGFGDAIAATAAAAATSELTAVAADPTSCGYWVLLEDGVVQSLGGASDLGGFESVSRRAGERFTALAATPSGQGLWGFTDHGRLVVLGDAQRHVTGGVSDLLSFALNAPIIASVVTPDGGGYYMLGADGGVFVFGNAVYQGSLPGLGVVPNEPAVGLVPDPDGLGYWIVAGDGGVFGFGAEYQGSLPPVLGVTPLNEPIVGMVSYGDGYLQVAADGGVFNFSTSPFLGSLGATPPDTPIVAIAPI